MLTRNKKERSASSDKSCPKNSNQQYSTVPCNDAVEVGEMVTMDHGGTSVGLDDDGEQMDHLQVAWLLREKLNGLVVGDKGEFPGLGLRSLLDMAASHNIVSLDLKMLNPVLWETLPKELLHLVLARLPVPDITRLRCLSTEWRNDMAIVNSEINQACNEASPTMIALLSVELSKKSKRHFVLIYDITKCTSWKYAYYLHLPRASNDDSNWPSGWTSGWTVADACDGGLVCFISRWEPAKRNALRILVVNLLTQVQHELPPRHFYLHFPGMVQIKVDSHTKCYQVVVAGNQSGFQIEIYDSSTRQWTRAMPRCGSIFGPVYGWYNRSYWPGGYVFVEDVLEVYREEHPSTGDSVIDSVLKKHHMFVVYKQTHMDASHQRRVHQGRDESVIASVLKKNHMFVLQKQTQMDASHRRRVHQGCRITEYHFENETKAWVQGKSYECPSFEKLLMGEFSLTACDGFVMLHYISLSQCYDWLLDLSTSEWSHLPKTSKDFKYTRREFLCRVHWNVIP